MADYAPTYTGRYRVRYTALGQEHVMTFRTGRAVITPATIAGRVKTFLDALANFRTSDWTVVAADYAGPDSTVFLPTTAPAPVAGVNGSIPQSFRPIYISFQGRSSGGSRASLYVYGVAVSPLVSTADVQDWRYTSAESATVAAAVAALNAATELSAIDDNPATWYPYANVGANGYYQRKRRG